MAETWFWVVFADDDAKTFNVGNPTTEDSDVTERTVVLQDRGRNVRIFTVGRAARQDLLPALSEMLRRGPAGYKHDPSLRW